MKEYLITCPYCFEKFKDDQVHFRMETFFKDTSELNEEGLELEELERMPESPKYTQMKIQTRNKSRFLVKNDELYESFWKDFGKTTEKASGADSDLGIDVWKLPVLNPEDRTDQNVLKEINHGAAGKEKFLIRDDDGMVKSVIDIFGKETRRRVCPYCHNPLPNLYGKHDVKFIAITGVTSSGKTVYISQLLKHLNDYCSYVKMAAQPLSNHDKEFIEDNKVKQGLALPVATVPGTLAQPIFFQLLRRDDKDRLVSNTIVFQDIAGEAFMSDNLLQKYGEFVTKADGIILILDPDQLKLISGQTEDDDAPEKVLETIHTAFVGDSDKPCSIPMAICVSKSDKFAPGRIELLESDISPVLTEDNETIPVFGSAEYNKLEPQIKRLMSENVKTRLELQYLNYNFFAFSATGCGVRRQTNMVITQGENPGEEIEEEIVEYHLDAPDSPKRIAEPVLWLFHQFGFIMSEVPILLPKPRKAPNGGKIGTGMYTKPGLLASLFKGERPVEIMRDLTQEEREALNYEPSNRAIRRR